MEVYIELLQVANCFQREVERDADYTTIRLSWLIARDIARTQNVEVYVFYGEFKTRLNEIAEAKKLLREGIKHDSHNQALYFALGNVCASQVYLKTPLRLLGKPWSWLGHKTSIEALEAAKEKAIGSHSSICTYCLLMAVLACLSMISFLMANSVEIVKRRRRKAKSKKRK